MYTLITILIILVCVLLTLIVLVQNPKGGGLGASLGGFSDQTMGVQRTTDFLEKSTWTLAIVLLTFSLLTSFFLPKSQQALPEQENSEIQEQIENAPLPIPSGTNLINPEQEGTTQPATEEPE